MIPCLTLSESIQQMYTIKIYDSITHDCVLIEPLANSEEFNLDKTVAYIDRLTRGMDETYWTISDGQRILFSNFDEDEKHEQD
jgi:hypothetical protein